MPHPLGPSSSGSAIGIDDAGHIIGTWTKQGGSQYAIYWTTPGAFTEVLAPTYNGHPRLFAGISSEGKICGNEYVDGGTPFTRAFVTTAPSFSFDVVSSWPSEFFG